MYQQMRQPESDHTLLNAFATRQCQRAFAELVARHGAMVYSAALRQVRRRDLADDVAQAVFLLLAQRASSLSSDLVLAAWLHKTCRYVALNALKMERRRERHERQAATMARTVNHPAQNNPAGWSSLWPILDEGIEKLGEPDRTAIVLRFLESRPLAEVGRQLGVSEDAAGMRVSRALERLRAFYHRRGIGLSTANLGVVLGLHLPHAMPPKLSAIVTHSSTLSHSMASAGSTRAAQLVRNMNRTLAWESARSAALALLTAAAVFLLLSVGVQWWITPSEPPAFSTQIALAEATPAPASRWMESHPLALP